MYTVFGLVCLSNVCPYGLFELLWMNIHDVLGKGLGFALLQETAPVTSDLHVCELRIEI